MNFNHLASFYDLLAFLVFGKSIFRAQTSHFDSITMGSKVLIVGGGTGWILEKLPVYCGEVTYVESSPKMIRKASRRKIPIPIRFVQKPVQLSDLDLNYDVIITNFFFDLFDELQGYDIGLILRRSLNKNGIWILTDFEKGGIWWQNVLLDLMYFFFSQTTGMKNKKLPGWKETMLKLQMVPESSNQYYGHFISSVRYGAVSSPV